MLNREAVQKHMHRQQLHERSNRKVQADQDGPGGQDQKAPGTIVGAAPDPLHFCQVILAADETSTAAAVCTVQLVRGTSRHSVHGYIAPSTQQCAVQTRQ